MNQSQSSPEYLDQLRHSAAHLLAAAVLEMHPETKLTIGPSTEDGFYYDFEFPEGISENDLKKLEKRMKRIQPTWKEFSHEEVSIDEAKKRFADNPYKLELINEIAERGETITLYTCGTFTDLCRGGHVEEPNKELKHFKLLSLAGAYWRGDENKAMLTRIYGTAFPTAEELETHLHNLEEAKKRDHRKLGQTLDLFTFSPLVGSGLPLFTPRGTVIRTELESFLRSIQEPYGYRQVHIPHIATSELYKTSGHWNKYKENLFYVQGKSGSEFVIKPMNCPHHTQLYASQPRSYRDLPLRFAETTTIYRDEKPGELLGLARVRSITQDDAHVFCTPDQLKEEIANVFSIVRAFYDAFDFTLEPHLSVRDPQTPDKYLGDDAIWDTAENQLELALNDSGMEFSRDEGEAAFYGPKIDFIARDSLNRKWQLATIQLDFNMPRRFDLAYTDSNGEEQPPVMIHRAISGSLERFMAILIEHYAGDFPLWLSPTQVSILPISDEQMEYAKTVQSELMRTGIRAEVDTRSESIGKKIRNAELMKVPVMCIVGQKEVEANQVSVRTRADGDRGAIAVDQLAAELTEKIAART